MRAEDVERPENASPPSALHRGAVLRAFLLAALLIAPSAARYFSSDGYSPAVFSDFDEAFYSGLALKTGATPLSELFWTDAEGRLFFGRNQDLFHPHMLVDVVVGKLVHALGLSAAELLLLLDFFAFFLSYLLLLQVFRRLGLSASEAETGALCVTLLPYLGAELHAIAVPISLFGLFYSVPFHSWVSLPLHRGIYTQVSLVVFFYSLLLGLQLFREKPRRRMLIAMGACLGSLLYLYFFTWAFATALFFFSHCWLFLFRHKQGLPCRPLAASEGAILVAAFTIVSLPGLVLVGLIRPTIPLTGEGEYLRFGFVSLEMFLGLAVALLVAYRSQRWRVLCIAIATVLTTELVLLNSQLVSPVWLTVYHFPVLFGGPLLGGLLVVVLLRKLKSPFLQGSCYWLLCLSGLGIVSYKSLTNFSSAYIPEATELLRYIDQELEDSSKIVSIPFDLPLFDDEVRTTKIIVPDWIDSLTKSSAAINLSSDISDRSIFYEYLTSYLLIGEFRTQGPCPDQVPPASTSILLSTDIYASLNRFRICESGKRFLQQEHFCEQLRRADFSHLLWEKRYAQYLPRPHAEHPFLKPLWRSSDAGRFELYRFERSALLQALCESPAEPWPPLLTQ